MKIHENTMSPLVFVFVFVLRPDKEFGFQGCLENDMKKQYKHPFTLLDMQVWPKYGRTKTYIAGSRASRGGSR